MRIFPRVFFSACCLSISLSALADNRAREVMAAVNARDDGQQLSRTMTLELTDRRGITRVEKTIGYRRYFGDDKKTVIFYTEPGNVRGTGFLTWDYADATVDDDQWLFLPALRKVRRVSASDRGDYFLGTDLSYEEVKKENKIELADYHYRWLGEVEHEGRRLTEVEATPVNDTILREIGYSKVVYGIDTAIAMPRRIDTWDIAGNPLKTIRNQQIEQIDGIWTATEVLVVNHKTGHRTRLQFSDIDYQTAIADRVFTRQTLERGLR